MGRTGGSAPGEPTSSRSILPPDGSGRPTDGPNFPPAVKRGDLTRRRDLQAMRVLHLSDNPMSAAPVRLAQIQNLCGLEARLISREDYTNDGPRKRVYPADLL